MRPRWVGVKVYLSDYQKIKLHRHFQMSWQGFESFQFPGDKIQTVHVDVLQSKDLQSAG